MPHETIHKYPFTIAEEFILDMPIGAEILTVECQNEVPTMWAKVDPSGKVMGRRFRIFGTDWPIDTRLSLMHVKSFQQGRFVWHVFEDLS